MSLLHAVEIITAPIWVPLILLVVWLILTAILGCLVWLWIRMGSK